MQIPSARDKFRRTLMEKYGVPNLAYLSRPASKQSQNLFWAIHCKMSNSLRNKNHFASLDSEFVVSYNGNHFKYDFVNSMLKKAIEYNGKNFHPRPSQSDDEIGWCAFHPERTVKEARAYEKKKYKALSSRKYEILTVWDFEYRKDFDKLVNKCLGFLLR